MPLAQRHSNSFLIIIIIIIIITIIVEVVIEQEEEEGRETPCLHHHHPHHHLPFSSSSSACICSFSVFAFCSSSSSSWLLLHNQSSAAIASASASSLETLLLLPPEPIILLLHHHLLLLRIDFPQTRLSPSSFSSIRIAHFSSFPPFPPPSSSSPPSSSFCPIATLDLDPKPARPPDAGPCSRSRGRSRSHKSKNGAKKLPQRGLGVAQLEKLRMEEESKQEFALQSLHRHSHAFLPQHPQILQFSSPHHPHPHPQSQHLHPPFSSFDDQSPLLAPFNNVASNAQHPLVALNGASHVQNSRANTFQGVLNPQNSIPSGLHGSSNVQNFHSGSFHGGLTVQNSLPTGHHGSPDVHNPIFVPLAGMAKSMQQNLASPRDFSPQHRAVQTRLLPHEFLKSTFHLPHPSFPLHVPATVAAIPGDSKHIQRSEVGRENLSPEEGGVPMDLLSSASLTRNAAENMEAAKEQGTGSHAPSAALHLSTEIHRHLPSTGRHSEAFLSSTDLYLQNPGICAPEVLAPSAKSLLSESSAVSIAPPGVQTRELSSFQNISLCSSWSPLDQVLDNRKRPWAGIQEHECRVEAVKGVDLNASADEIQSESTEQDTCFSVPSIRDNWNLSPTVTPKSTMRDENYSKLISTTNSCNECGSRGGEKSRAMIETPDMLVGVTGFLSLRKTTLKYDMQDAGLGAPDFLTLGPICSIQELGNIPSQNGNSDGRSITRKPVENAANHMHQKASHNQTDSVEEVIFMPESTVGLLEQCQMKPQFTDKLAWKFEDQCSSYLSQSQTEEYLDLELRLSI